MSKLTLYTLHMDTNDSFVTRVFLDRQSAVDHRATMLAGIENDDGESAALDDTEINNEYTSDGVNVTTITEHIIDLRDEGRTS